MQRNALPNILLTLGLAFVFGWFGFDKLMHPEFWLGWIPMGMEGLLSFSREGWLTIIGCTEMLFALLILIPVRAVRRVGTVLIALHLVAILTQTGWNDIAVRDIGLLFMTMGLFALI